MPKPFEAVRQSRLSAQESLRRFRAEQEASNWTKLRELLSLPDVSPAQGEELAKITDSLGLDDARVVQLAKVLRDEADLAAAAAVATPALSAEIDAAEQRSAAAERELAETTERLQAEADRLANVASELRKRRADAIRAGDELRKLKVKHWRLFGEPDPDAPAPVAPVAPVADAKPVTPPAVVPSPPAPRPQRVPTIVVDNSEKVVLSDGRTFYGPGKRDSAQAAIDEWTPDVPADAAPEVAAEEHVDQLAVADA